MVSFHSSDGSGGRISASGGSGDGGGHDGGGGIYRLPGDGGRYHKQASGLSALTGLSEGDHDDASVTSSLSGTLPDPDRHPGAAAGGVHRGEVLPPSAPALTRDHLGGSRAGSAGAGGAASGGATAAARGRIEEIMSAYLPGGLDHHHHDRGGAAATAARADLARAEARGADLARELRAAQERLAATAARERSARAAAGEAERRAGEAERKLRREEERGAEREREREAMKEEFEQDLEEQKGACGTSPRPSVSGGGGPASWRNAATSPRMLGGVLYQSSPQLWEGLPVDTLGYLYSVLFITVTVPRLLDCAR